MSSYYITGNGMVSEEELQHYGVLGMKWGVRRGRTEKAYSKASKKLKKLEIKADKKQQKANKKLKQAQRARYGISFRNADKTMRKAAGIQYRADKRKKKAVNWLNKMENVFAETPVKMNKEQVTLGERYVKELSAREDSWARSYF